MAVSEKQTKQIIEEHQPGEKVMPVQEETSRAAFLRICMEQVRCRRMRPALAAELQDHIEDQKNAYLEEGKTEEEAETLAVKQMGDPVETGIAFDRVHRPRMDWYAIGMVLTAVLVGAILYGILYREGVVGQTLFYNFLEGTLLGLPIMVAVCFLDYTVLSKYPGQIWFGGLALVLFITFQTGEINGMRHVEWATMLLMPLFSGVVYHYRTQRWLGIVKVLAVFCVSFLALHLGGALDRSSMRILFCCGCLGMLLLAIAKGWYQVPRKTAFILSCVMLTGVGVLCGVSYLFGDFRRQRILAWLHPEEYADGAGYLAVQMSMIRNQLKWTGSGSADIKWMQQVMETQENYLFLGMLHCFGIIVSAVVLLLLVRLGFVLFGKVRRIKNRLGYLVGVACCLTFAVPLILHVAINLGWLPVTDCWMPFFSGGGKSCVAFYAILGLMLSVFRNKDCAPERAVGKTVSYF